MKRDPTSPPMLATLGHRFLDATVEQRAAAPYGVEVRNFGQLPREEALRAARPAAGILLGLAFRLDAAQFDRLPSCRVVVRYGIGVDNVDVDDARRRGIAVFNVPDYGVEEVANHTLALLLGLGRRLDVLMRRARDRAWSEALQGIEIKRLSRTTLGVVGAGRIGRAVIARARTIWGTVLVYDPYAPHEVAADPRLVRMPELRGLLQESDFVTIHVPSSPETRGMLSGTLLRQLKRGAVLVNCSRGDVLDEETLIELLASGHLAAAGLDVFAREPHPDPRLLRLDNVWPTPHAAWYSADSVIDLRFRAAERAAQHITGGAQRGGGAAGAGDGGEPGPA